MSKMDPRDGKDRISVANLAVRVRIAETGERFFVALLNRKRLENDGVHIYAAIGGAAEMTPAGKARLETEFGAFMPRSDNDARFYVEPDQVPDVMALFEGRDPDFCEVDPTREMREELLGTELPGMPPILSAEDAPLISCCYVKSVHQAMPGGIRSSARDHDEPRTLRYFHLFEMVMPQVVFDRLVVHEGIIVVTEAEIATTEDGAKRGVTADGQMLGSNMIW